MSHLKLHSNELRLLNMYVSGKGYSLIVFTLDNHGVRSITD